MTTFHFNAQQLVLDFQAPVGDGVIDMAVLFSYFTTVTTNALLILCSVVEALPRVIELVQHNLPLGIVSQH